MALTRRVAWLGLALLVTGCQARLNVDKSYRLDGGQIQTFEIDGPRGEQKTTLTVDSDGPVSVCIFLKKESDAVEKSLAARTEKPITALGFWTGDGKGTLEATVPAREIVVVRIESAKKPANVKIHVESK